MASIPELYNLQRSSSGGIEGYYVEKKYYDPAKMKEQRILSTSKDKPVSARPVNVSKKTTFIDDVQKIAAKLPGPTSYESTLQMRSRAGSDIIKHPDRKTFIDEIAHLEKKKHVPGAGTYGKIVTEADKTKLRPNLSRAQSPTYLQASMRNSLDCPGVGNYNSYNPAVDRNRGNKWVREEGKKKSASVKLPSVGTYNPNPVSYSLFGGNQIKPKSGLAGMGGKSERWQKSKEKKLPFYNVLSEWGMKDKYTKKDIMSKVSSGAGSRSVYY